MIRIEKKLIDYFKQNTDTTVDSETLLIEEGVIDSMGVMELIAFIEANYNVKLIEDDLTIENFKTIGSIKKLILSKNEGQSP